MLCGVGKNTLGNPFYTFAPYHSSESADVTCDLPQQNPVANFFFILKESYFSYRKIWNLYKGIVSDSFDTEYRFYLFGKKFNFTLSCFSFLTGHSFLLSLLYWFFHIVGKQVLEGRVLEISLQTLSLFWWLGAGRGILLNGLHAQQSPSWGWILQHWDHGLNQNQKSNS